MLKKQYVSSSSHSLHFFFLIHKIKENRGQSYNVHIFSPRPYSAMFMLILTTFGLFFYFLLNDFWISMDMTLHRFLIFRFDISWFYRSITTCINYCYRNDWSLWLWYFYSDSHSILNHFSNQQFDSSID